MFIFRKKVSFHSKLFSGNKVFSGNNLFSDSKLSLHNICGVSFFIAALCCMFFVFPIAGYAKEMESVSELQENSISKEIYHRHVGTSEECGGCYTVRKERVEGPCAGMVYYQAEKNISVCDVCGGTFLGDLSGNRCKTLRPGDRIVYYYELGCGMTEQSCVGVLTVSKSTTEWAKKVVLTASYEVTDGLHVLEKPYIWNGGEPSVANTYEVTGNGRYSVRLNTDAYADSESARIDVDIQNIDVNGPSMLSYSKDPEEKWTRGRVAVAIARTSDLQENGREGCGLHNEPYSFDNGNTWTHSPLRTYEKNGTYAVWLRDKLGNQALHHITISNIDTTPPEVKVEYNREANLSKVELEVVANDLQQDKSEGVGLHAQPYSFDNGVTWTADNKFCVESNTAVKIAVRDLLGNVSYAEVKVSNIDTTGPKINYKMNSVSWTKENVELSLFATDKNADGSEGCGLPEKWYSVDGGKTWTDEAVRVIEENQRIHILARDKNNNTSEVTLYVNQIDREAPQLVLSAVKMVEKGKKKVRLTVSAYDAKSGMDESAFSWDKGATFSKKTECDVEKNGEYTVLARDKAGNVAKTSVTVDVLNGEIKVENKDETESKEKQEENTQGDTTQGEKDEEDSEETSEESTTETESEESGTDEGIRPGKTTVRTNERWQTEKEEWNKDESVNTEGKNAFGEEAIIGEANETLVVMEEINDGPTPSQEKKIKQEKAKEVVVTVVSGTLIVFIIAGIMLLLFMKYRMVKMYVYDNKNEKTFLGFKWIRQSGEHYMVEISQECLEECMTGRFCFYPDTFFVKNHLEEEIYFLFPEKVCITQKISEKMEISLY